MDRNKVHRARDIPVEDLRTPHRKLTVYIILGQDMAPAVGPFVSEPGGVVGFGGIGGPGG